MYQLPPNGPPVDLPYKESSRAYYWFFAMTDLNCSANSLTVDYTITLTQVRLVCTVLPLLVDRMEEAEYSLVQ